MLESVAFQNLGESIQSVLDVMKQVSTLKKFKVCI